MRCVLVALAEAANTTIEGKLNLLAEFDIIHARSFPTAWPQMVFVAKLKTSEVDLGEHSLQLRVLDEDMHLVSVLVDGRIVMDENPNPGIESGLPILMPIRMAKFDRPGTYNFQLVVDGEVVCEAPLHVRLAPPVPPQAPTD